MRQTESIFKNCLIRYLSKLEPSPEQRKRIAEAAEEVLSVLHTLVKNEGLENIVHNISVHGSFARDTWLPENTDIDIFILFDLNLTFDKIQAITERLSAQTARLLGAVLETRFASHPYYIVKYKGVEIEIVPAYKVDNPREIKTAVDRTPFHTDYVVARLSSKPELKNEIRFFKALLKRLGIYGAELEVRGFSGYLSEVLVILHGGLLPLLFTASNWKPWRVLIPPEAPQKWRGAAPLVVLDPVDPRRNMAAAVGVEQLSKLIAFSRVFIHHPEILCCMMEDWEEKVEYKLDKNVIIIRVLSHPPLVEDALAGKTRRILDSTVNALSRNGFNVLRKLLVNIGGEFFLVIQLEQSELPPLEKREGPPVWHENSLNFLKKWAFNTPPPFIEGDRWVVITQRRTRTAEEIIRTILRAYAGFEWEIFSGDQITEKLEDKYSREIAYSLAGLEPWITCLRRYLSGPG
ncbi:MAG: CCA tRNA nucleotidyltransferase [Infirmifilum sp.]